MIKSIALALLLNGSAFKKDQPIIVVEGDFLGCTGIVLDYIEGPFDNLYDLSLDYCPTRYIKSRYLLDNVSEAFIRDFSNPNK